MLVSLEVPNYNCLKVKMIHYNAIMGKTPSLNKQYTDSDSSSSSRISKTGQQDQYLQGIQIQKICKIKD